MSERRGADGRFPYQRIADKLRHEIETGRYPPGSQLPSERHLKRRFNVSRMTVRAAVQMLREEGLVCPRHGIGVYVRRPGEDLRTTVAVEAVDEAEPSGRLEDKLDSLLERLDALEHRLEP